jgi:thymidylate synthase (FAD)
MTERLVSVSQPVGEFKEVADNALELIAYCAKVSNPANQANLESSNKLVKYLIDNKHWSPLEMVSVCIEVNPTRAIGRQLLRHRSFSFQEFSQRYADASSLGFTLSEARMQDTKNRQNSIDLMTDEERKLEIEWRKRQIALLNQTKEDYQWALDQGIAKEQARNILPEGNTDSRLYVNGTLRSWYHYCQLRCANGTQKEHMEMARGCAREIETIYTGFYDLTVGIDITEAT